MKELILPEPSNYIVRVDENGRMRGDYSRVPASARPLDVLEVDAETYRLLKGRKHRLVNGKPVAVDPAAEIVAEFQAGKCNYSEARLALYNRRSLTPDRLLDAIVQKNFDNDSRAFDAIQVERAAVKALIPKPGA